MKKSLFIAALLVVGVASSFAVEYTAKAKITLGSNALTLREAAQFSDAFDNGYDASQFNKTGIVVEAVVPEQTTTEWAQWATNDLEGVVVAFKVAAAGEQTLTFSGVQGTPLYLVDAVTGARTAIVNDGTYVFTAEAADVSAWNTTRFTISKVATIAPYSFINNTLVITEATGEVTVTPFTYAEGGKSLGTPENHDPSAPIVLSGNYFLVTYETAEGTREFIVNANPDVQPAND